MSKGQQRGGGQHRSNPEPAAPPAAAAEAPVVDSGVMSVERATLPPLAPAKAALTPPNEQGWLRCRALQSCLVRGVHEESGKEFWLEPEGAERLVSKGSVVLI